MVFLVLKTLWYVDEDDAVETGEIAMFVGDDFVVTVRHGQGNELHTARSELETSRQVLSHGPGGVLYAVMDRVVDEYLDVVDELIVDVDEIEASVFSNQRTNDSARIYVLKRELAEVRRAVLPLREPGEPTGERRPARRTRVGGAVLPRRLRPPGPSGRDRRLPRLAAVDGVRRAPGADLGAAERRHAQDLGWRRAGRGADPDRRRSTG